MKLFCGICGPAQVSPERLVDLGAPALAPPPDAGDDMKRKGEGRVKRWVENAKKWIQNRKHKEGNGEQKRKEVEWRPETQSNLHKHDTELTHSLTCEIHDGRNRACNTKHVRDG